MGGIVFGSTQFLIAPKGFSFGGRGSGSGSGSVYLGGGSAPRSRGGGGGGGGGSPVPGTIPNTEGPRLEDLTVNSSAYGSSRPILYGTMRVKGQVIWSAGIGEKEITTSGPTGDDTQYSYFGTFAVAFCEGTMGALIRLWANGDLIYDARDTGALNGVVRTPGLSFKFYNGSETQPQDLTILETEDADITPAYRGTCYIVFKEMALSDYNNSVPTIDAEIAKVAPTIRSQVVGAPWPSGTTNYSDNHFAIDWDRNFAYYSEVGNDYPGYIVKADIVTGDVVLKQPHTLIYSGVSRIPTNQGSMSITPGGDVILTAAGGPNSSPIVILDGTTLYEKSRFGVAGLGLEFSPTSWRAVREFAFTNCLDPNFQNEFVLCMAPSTNMLGLLKVNISPDPWNPETGLLFLWSTSEFNTGLVTDARIHGVVGGKQDFGVCTAWALGGPIGISSDPWALYKIEITKNARGWESSYTPGLWGYNGVTATRHQEFSVADLIPGEVNLSDVNGLVYDTRHNRILMKVRGDGGPSGSGPVVDVMVAYDIDTGTIAWRSPDMSIFTSVQQWNQSRVTGTTFGFIAGATGIQLDTTDGSLIFNKAAPDWAISGIPDQTLGAYDSDTESYVSLFPVAGGQGPMIRFNFGRWHSTTEPLNEIVEHLTLRAGIALADINTNTLNTVDVNGFAINTASTARGAIDTLSLIYQFDSYESDWTINYKFQGQNSLRIILETDLAIQSSDTGNTYSEIRSQEVELPERFTLNYIDFTNNYLSSAQTTQRVLLPEPAMSSSNRFELSAGIAMTPTIAKQQAEKLMYSAWVERASYQFQLPWTYLDLDPSDVITISLDDGGSILSRLTSLDISAGFTIDANSTRQQSDQFTSTVTGDGGSGVPDQSIDGAIAVRGFLLDSPLINDYDDIGRTAGNIYALSSGYRDDTYTSARTYYSPNNTNFELVDTQIYPVSYGSVLLAMLDPPYDNPHATDNNSTLDIQMAIGGINLTTITYAQMVNGGNRAALLKLNGEIEIIHFQNVTNNADGTYTLDTFMRGRRGTDTMAFNHTGGEEFLLLTDNLTPVALGLPLEQLDISSYYKVVGSLQLFQAAPLTTLVSNHRSLMPYAPSSIEAIEDGSNNIDFTWSRRTRIGGDLINTIGEVLLEEDTEEYELDILDGPGTTATETFTSTIFLGWDTETVTIDGKVYTFQDILTNVDGNVLIGANASDSIDNLIAAINKDTGLGIPGVRYAAATIVHPTVEAAIGAGDTMDITAKKPGVFSNLIQLSTDISGASWGDSVMSGGADGTVLRTISGLINPDYEYLNADIITDFGSVPISITVKVYQISAQVGRGFAQEITTDVQ